MKTGSGNGKGAVSEWSLTPHRSFRSREWPTFEKRGT